MLLSGGDMAKSRQHGLSILFLHQNFPAQYYHIARHYAANPANTVVAVGEESNLRHGQRLPGIWYAPYTLPRGFTATNTAIHHYVRGYQAQVRRGQAVARLLGTLAGKGFEPDLVLVHPAWGEALFLRIIWPRVPVLAYAEAYGDPWGAAYDFDSEFPVSMDVRCAVQAANAALAVSYADADHLQTPTRFQLSLLPSAFQSKTSLTYDGINTSAFAPSATTKLILPPDADCVTPENSQLPAWFPQRTRPLCLTRQDKIVSFVVRTLEPWRGWHSFARAIPCIQAACPDCHFVIAGRTGGGYGPPPEKTEKQGNWRDMFLDEIRDTADLTRLHFVGTVDPGFVRDLFRITSAHVYLSYPFFLSYSPVEAMSSAAPLLLSDTAPCREVAEEGKHALFANFFSPEGIAKKVIQLLQDTEYARTLGQAARQHVLENYDFKRVCLPRWHTLIEALAHKQQPVPDLRYR